MEFNKLLTVGWGVWGGGGRCFEVERQGKSPRHTLGEKRFRDIEKRSEKTMSKRGERIGWSSMTRRKRCG